MTAGGGPVFLAGVDRTGIGLLGELLDAHPDIAISKRTNFHSFYRDRFGDLTTPENLERCLEAMSRYTRILALEPDFDAVGRQFRQGPASYARLFTIIQEQRIARIGKRRWGDKSLGAERHAGSLLVEYPDSRIVHVIRDPRDRYASQATHRSAGRGGVGSGTALWRWSVALADRFSRCHPDRYLVVRYEDLVTEPVQTLTTVCTFIGERFDEQMLAALEGEGGDRTAALHSRSVGRFRRDLTPREIAFIQLWTSARMRRHGYAVEPVELTWADRSRFLAKDLPLGTAALVLREPWMRLWESVGRRPSDRRTVTAS